MAALLLMPATVWWADLAALQCLAAFTTLIGVHLAHGRRPACNCFGQASPRPISVNNLLRNGVLIACSLLIVSFGRGHEYSGSVAWWHTFATEFDVASILIGVLLVLAVLPGWVVFSLLRQQGRLMPRIDNLELRIEAAVSVRRFRRLPHPWACRWASPHLALRCRSSEAASCLSTP